LYNHFIAKRFLLLRVLFFVRPDVNGKDEVDNGGLGGGTVGFTNINSWLLVDAFCNEVSFVLADEGICFVLELEHPFASTCQHSYQR
jgi:hypothetical protein